MKMQQLRIQTEDSAALSLANEACPHSSHTNLREIPNSLSFGRISQAAPSIQTPERQRRLALQATQPTPRVPGHLSFLATRSSEPEAAVDQQNPDQDREPTAIRGQGVISAPRIHVQAPTKHVPVSKIARISYPPLGPTPKFPGHLSNAADHKLSEHEREPVSSGPSPSNPLGRRSPRPASPPVYYQQPPSHNAAENRPNDEEKKNYVVSVIQAISSRPLADTKIGVIADMILQSRTSTEIEGIISALDQSFPIVSVLGRLRNIVNVQEYAYIIDVFMIIRIF